MFTLAVRAEMLPHRPHIALLDESGNVREGFLEPAEFEAVCSRLPTYLQDALRFAPHRVASWCSARPRVAGR